MLHDWAMVGNLIECSPLPLCPFGGLAVIWVLKALSFFRVSP